MKIKIIAIVALMGIGIVAAVLIVPRMSQPSKPVGIPDTKYDCVLDNVDLFDFTDSQTCNLFRESAMGIEVDFSFYESRDGKSRRFSLNVPSMSKREILDEIIRNNPGYNWKEQNGVINIQPYQAESIPKTISPLDMTISSFEVHGITPYSALEHLRRLGQEHKIPITTITYEISAERGGKLPDPGKPDHPEAYDPKQLIDVVIPHEVSIRDCLNAIVLADPPANWRAIKKHSNSDKTSLTLSSSQQGYSERKI